MGFLVVEEDDTQHGCHKVDSEDLRLLDRFVEVLEDTLELTS